MDERAIIRRHSKSFAMAARLLSPAVRGHAEKLYAWCRYADDAIDLAPTPLAAVVALADLRADLDAIYAGRPVNSPAGKMLATVVSDIRLPREYPDELLAGMAMDAAGTRYRTLDELLLYCHRVAGVVGLMMCHAMGVADERSAVHAGHLGIAMQLTNIARDVAEDWSRGRLYLPLDWLDGEPPQDRPLEDATTAPVVRRLLDVADRYYASGEAGLIHLDRRSRLAVRVARTVYAEIGSEVRRAGCRPSAGRAVVHAGHLGIAMQLTNIARDVAEDWSRGRLYLPLDWLGGEPPQDRPLDDATTAPVVRRLLDVADGYYASGEAGLIHLDRRSRLAVRVARTVYAEIGSEVRRAGCRPSAGRAVVSKARKLRAVASAVCQAHTEPRTPRVTPPIGVWGLRPLDEWPRETIPFPLSEKTMNGSRDSMYLVTFGLALVLLMSTVLFLFVGLNPKKEEYSYLPWLYSGISAVGSVAFWVVSSRLGRIKGAPGGMTPAAVTSVVRNP